MFSLRPATKDDDSAIRRLIHVGGINPTGLDWRRFVVAVSPEGQVIGCGQIKPHGDGSRELASLVVDPGWRGQGVARAIIEHLLAAHPDPLYLMCRSELEPLYGRFGFRSLQPGEMPPYFRRIHRLVHLFGKLNSRGVRLRVMKRG